MINVDLPMLLESTDPSNLDYAKQSNTSMLLGVTGTIHVLALIASVLRIYTRLLVVKRFRVEDYFVAVSTVCHPDHSHSEIRALLMTACSI